MLLKVSIIIVVPKYNSRQLNVVGATSINSSCGSNSSSISDAAFPNQSEVAVLLKIKKEYQSKSTK